MKRYLSLILCLFSSTPAVFGQTPSFLKDSMEAYIEKGMRDWKVPGLAIAIIKDGKIIHAKGYGVQGIDSSEPVNESTLFQIASQSKLFTATDLALLEDQRKLSWMSQYKSTGLGLPFRTKRRPKWPLYEIYYRTGLALKIFKVTLCIGTGSCPGRMLFALCAS